jgi:MFS family permease
MSDLVLKNKNIVKFVLLWLCSLSVMCTGVVSPALPIIKKHFTDLQIENAAMLVKMMVVVPNLFIAICSPIFGYFAVKVGKIRMLTLGIILYAISGTSGLYLNDLKHIIFFRALLGIAIAAVMTVTITLIADYFDSTERSSLVGLQTTFMSIGSTVYAVLSGIIADINWKNIFYLYLMAVIVLPFVRIFLFEPSTDPSKNNHHKSDTKIIQNNFAIFLVCAVNLITMSMFYMVWLQLPFLLYNDPAFINSGINAKKVATATSMEVIFAAALSLKYRRFKKNRDFAVMCAMAFAFMSLSYVIIAHANHYAVILVAMGVCGIGMGLMMPNSTLWVISITKPENRPLFLGIFTTSTFLGKFFSPLIAAPLIAATSIRSTFLIDAFLMLFVAVLSMYLNDYFKRVNRAIFRAEFRAQQQHNIVK